jgi:hypothetical protein
MMDPSRLIIPMKRRSSNHLVLYTIARADGLPKSFSINVATAIEIANSAIITAINRDEKRNSAAFFIMGKL